MQIEKFEKRLKGEKLLRRRATSTNSINNGVKRSSNSNKSHDDYVGDAAQDAKDGVYYHPTLNPLGKPPPGSREVRAKEEAGRWTAGMALPAPEKRKRKRDGEGGTESSSGESSGRRRRGRREYFHQNVKR